MAEPTPGGLFICYSHTDQKYREQFHKFLQADSLKNVNIFSDVLIEPGQDWEQTIIGHLQEATAALVLVSQDFMISPFIQRVELRELLTSNIRRGLRLFLVPVRPTNYQGTYLERFQWARPPDQPLSLLEQPQQEKAMVEVCLRIAKQLSSPPDEPTIAQTIECVESIPKLDLPSLYELREPVGEGQFARCFRAHDHLLDREVIIKVLTTELSRDSPAYDKYIRSASKLTHRNILGVLFSQANKLPHFIVTPALEKPPLDKRLATEPAPTMKEAIGWTIRLADALAYAHRQGCVHGRLRPSEVRFDRDDEPVLSGFRTVEGCATVPGASNGDKFTLEEFQYASPEHRECGVIDAKGDQYLLGLLAYEMIAGSPPARLTSWASILDPAIMQRLLHPRPLYDVAPGCDERVSNAVMRMLSVDPAARWHSLDVVRDQLEDALSNTSCVEEAMASYRRCAGDDGFYQTLYETLFQALPEIRGMFTHRTMPEQYQVLREALLLLLTYPETRHRGEPTILGRIARTHAHFEPKQFDVFCEAVVTAVERHDPRGRDAAEAWREAMLPGIEYLKTHAGAGVRMGAGG
jgi:hypothetical protein